MRMRLFKEKLDGFHWQEHFSAIRKADKTIFIIKTLSVFIQGIYFYEANSLGYIE